MADSSAGGGKIRSRRTAPQRKPYSRGQRKSFFTKVSDSVKSILTPITPRWLVNFRGNVEPQTSTQSDEQGALSHTIDVATEESSSQDIEFVNHTNNNLKHSQLSRPPLKHFQASTLPSHCLNTHDVQVSEETRTKEVSSSGEGLIKHLEMISKRAKIDVDLPLTSDSSYLRREMKTLSTTDNASVASSSDCSSVRMGSQRADGSDRESIGKHASSSRDTSLLSLSSMSRPQSTTGSSKRPRFNLAVFGMRTMGLPSPEPCQSSFYDGSVQYGGANASGRSPYFATPYKIPSVTKVKVRHVNYQRTPAKVPHVPSRSASLPLDESMSSTARKILHTLEKMSSPLNDARKIPTISRTPSSYAATRSRRHGHRSSLLQDSTVEPPTTGLSSPSTAKLRRRTHTPSSNSLLKHKHKEKEVPLSKANTSTTETIINTEKTDVQTSSTNFVAPDSRAIAARGLPAPIASMSSSAEIVRPSKSPFATPNSSGGGKMKSGKKSSTHYTSLAQEDDGVVRQPKLPSVTLAVSSLPSFNFGSKEMTSTPAAAPPVINSKRIKSVDDPKFSFASPIVSVKTSHSKQPSLSASNTPKYQFSSPSSKSAESQDTHPVSPSKGSVAPTEIFTPSPKVLSAVKAAGKRTASPLETSVKPQSKIKTPEPLKIGSVMDILGGKSSKEQDNTSDSKVATSKNDESDSRNSPKPISSSTTSLFNPLPMQQSAGWDCEICLVPNDATCDTCVACGTSKPGSSKSAVGFNKMPELSKDKPAYTFGLGSEKKSASSTKAENVSGFGFKAAAADGSSTVGFKFGPPAIKSPDASSQPLPKISGWGDLMKKSSGEWECEVCMVSNSTEVKSCDACNSPKPGTKPESNTSFKFGSNSSGLFKFGAPTTKQNNETKSQTSEIATQTSQSVVTTKPAAETAKSSISFGIPSNAPVPSKIVQFSSESTAKVGMKPSFSFGQKIGPSQTSQLTTPKLTTFTVPEKNDAVLASSQPSKTPTLPQTKGLPKFRIGASLSPSLSVQTLPAVSVPSATFGNAASNIAKSAPVSAFGMAGGTSSGIQLKPSFPAAFDSGPETEQKALPTFSFGVKPAGAAASQSQDTVVAKPPQPAFAFGAKSANPPAFGAATSQSESSSKVTSTTSGFGAKVPGQDSVNKPSSFMNAGANFSGFGQPSGTGQTTTSEPSNPLFGGFGATPSMSASQPTGGIGGIFSSLAKPATVNPFGGGAGGSSTQPPPPANPATVNPFGGGAGGSSTQPPAKPATVNPFGGGAGGSSTQPPPPAFGSTSGSTSNPFGAAAAGAKSTFGSPATSNVFGGASAVGQLVFGQSSGSTKDLPKPAGFGGDTGSGTSAFGQPSSAATSSLPKPNLGFGSGTTNAASTAGGFSFGTSNTQSSSAFQFGAGAPQSTTSQPGSGYNFGSTTQNSSVAGTGGFAFGGSNSGPNKGVYQFGANQSGSSSAAPSTGFNFGGSATPSFNFTGGNQSSVSPAFGSTSAPGPNIFEPGKSTSSGQQRRVIKTARRKLRK